MSKNVSGERLAMIYGTRKGAKKTSPSAKQRRRRKGAKAS